MPTSITPQLDAILEKMEHHIARSASTRDLQELRAIIRRPGWTTAAEQAFFLALATALNDHLEAGAKMREALLEASKQVSPIPRERENGTSP